MELRQLKYFAKVARLHSFSEAAKALNITQSTLSQQVRKLEDELNVLLLLRDSHHVQLTDVGAAILPSVEQTLRDASKCVEMIHDVQNLNTGVLTIGATPTFSPLLRGAVKMFVKEYPGVKLNIICKSMEELMQMLDDEEIDLALSYKPTTPLFDNIDSHVLFENRLCVVVRENHELASCQMVRLPDLERYPMALPAKGMQARNTLDSLIHPMGLRLDVRFEINEINILLDMVRESQYITLLSQATIPADTGLVAIPLDSEGADMQGCFHFRKGTYRKKTTRRFLQMLCESNTFGIARMLLM